MPATFQHFEIMTRPDGSPWELGRGSLGVTYRAMDKNLRAAVALKVLTGVQDPATREKFLTEARAAASLRHTNITAVFHLGEQDGQAFYAMELVEGRTLAERLKDSGTLPLQEGLTIALQVARALAAAARQGLSHGSLRPEDLLLLRDDDGRTLVKITAFGLSGFHADRQASDAEFASPETAAGKPANLRSDLYSLGAILHRTLTGQPHGRSSASALNALPAKVGSLIRSLLEADPVKRPSDATVVRIELEKCLSESAATKAVPPPLPAAKPEKKSRAPLLIILGLVLAAGLAVIILAIAGSAGLWFYYSFKEKPAPQAAAQAAPSATPDAPTPELAAQVPPTEPAQPTPAPAANPSATPDDWAARVDAFLAEDNPKAALEVSLDAAQRLPGSKAPEEKLEMIAALLRSNGYNLTSTKFEALRDLLEAAAARDVVSAQVLLGEEFRNTDPARSLRWFKAAAMNGQTEAMTQAGLLLSNHRGSSAPDLAQAVEWFRKASDAGNVDAMTALAECLIRGKGVEKNPRRAAELLQTATALNQPLAFNLLGDLYARGNGVPKNDAEALRLFERGAELGSGEALANLGVLHLRGQGVPANPAKAVSLWKSGAERGYPACMLNYAKALVSGSGTKADPVAAKRWFRDAALAGNAEAIAWCEKNGVEL